MLSAMSTHVEPHRPPEPLRRRDREITDPAAIDDILRRARVGRLGLISKGEPYVVPLNYGYRDRRVYFHSSPRGRKLDAIRANDRVCFEVDLDHRLVTGPTACDWGFAYRSVIGFGRARILDDDAEKLAGMEAIMAHLGEDDPDFKKLRIDRVAVVEIEFGRITGKQARQ